ncbi:GTPase IMAP family member 8-like [Patella vulgata]|uniref:GTPase IMAP family member 8-like n=1 Tax=Patella vulgata TaxID=6465 RepID=UPI0024A9889E|nr:GTPase IMAP family member 8-like [Patella vulgata]
MASGDREDIRLVLLGKKGVGKSSLGNSLLGRKEFKSTPLQAKCRKGSTTLADGTNLDAVDTPGIADTTASTTETFEELTRCIELSTPGPHVFLLVLKIDRFTQEEIDTIKHLKYWFGQDFMKYAVFIFTGKDSLDYDGSTINQYLENSPSEMKALIGDAGRRVAAINNRGRGPELKVDVKTIMTLVKQAIRINNCQYYTKEMYQQAVQARAKQRGWVEDERFNGEKDLRIRETLKRYREDEEAQRTRKNKDLHIETMPSENSNSEIRIVILGKTGVGKSSLGNHLIQNNCFQSSSTGTSVTSICQFGQGKRSDGTTLCVVDTPGLFDTRQSNKETMTEIVRCIGLSSPGPHVFFFVLRIGRFTKEDLDTVDHLVAVFGETVVHHVVVIFTGKDSLEHEGKTLSDYLNDKTTPHELNLLLQRCHSRCAAINNHAPDTHADIDGIINLVHKTIQENGGNHYTGKIYLAAEEAMREKMKSMEEGRKTERQYAEREQTEMPQEKEKLMAGLGENMSSDSRSILRELLASSSLILTSLIETVGPILVTALAQIAQKRCTIS